MALTIKRNNMSYYQKRRKLDRKTAMSAHAKKRIAERYGVIMTSDDLKNVVSMIQAGECVHKERISHRLSKHEVTIRDKTFLVVYDRNRHCIVTFLPREE